MLQMSLFQKVAIWLTVAVGILLAMPNGFYTTVEKHNDALAFLETGVSPNAETSQLTPEQLEANRAGWPEFLPSSLVNLGLDLRGGAHLLAEVQVEDVYDDRMDGYWLEIRDTLRTERATIGHDPPPKRPARRTARHCVEPRRPCNRRWPWSAPSPHRWCR